MSDSVLDNILDDGIDPRYAAAGDILVKIAEDEGVDLDSFSDDEIGTMLTDIVEQDATGEDEGYEASGHEGGEGEGYEEPTGEDMGKASSITHGTVSRELAKIASSEGVDLSALSQAEYDEVYNDLANAMAEPGYFQKQAAAQEKFAEADAIGRAMAHSFDDELRKLAELEKEALSAAQAGHYVREGARKALGQPKRVAAAVARGARAAGGAVGGAAKKVRSAEAGAAERLGKRIGDIGRGEAGEAGRAGKAVMALAKRLKGGTSAERLARARKMVARGAVGTGALTLGAGGAAAYKASFDEDVLEAARGLLIESGIDPDSGEKIASDDYNDQVMAGAVALLEENGYTFD